MIDFVQYGDTDSIFLSVEKIIEHHCGLKKWNTLSDEIKLQYCKKISKSIIDYLNEKSFEKVQLQDYNSQELDFKITFKQEIVAKSGIFVAKKKYSLWVVDEEGIPVDKRHTRGLEIIQSSCPQAIRQRLESIIDLILKSWDEDVLATKIKEDVEYLRTVIPEEIALNIGVNSVGKYHENGEPKKGCPYHVKGVLNYRSLVEELSLRGKAPDLGSGMKVKTVYIKPNRWKYDTVSFIKWIEEFDSLGIEVDYDKMIEKTYLHKISFLLEPIGKADLIQEFLKPKVRKKKVNKQEELLYNESEE